MPDGLDFIVYRNNDAEIDRHKKLHVDGEAGLPVKRRFNLLRLHY
jgi:hypothetical protein